jgi:hypothetical protein
MLLQKELNCRIPKIVLYFVIAVLGEVEMYSISSHLFLRNSREVEFCCNIRSFLLDLWPIPEMMDHQTSTEILVNSQNKYDDVVQKIFWICFRKYLKSWHIAILQKIVFKFERDLSNLFVVRDNEVSAFGMSRLQLKSKLQFFFFGSFDTCLLINFTNRWTREMKCTAWFRLVLQKNAINQFS